MRSAESSTSEFLATMAAVVIMLVLLVLAVEAWDRQEDARSLRVARHVAAMAPEVTR